MYKKLRKKIAISISLSVFALLAITLLVLNISNFIGVSEEADRVTERIELNSGSLDPNEHHGVPGEMSPEGLGSIHYFVYDSKNDTFSNYNLVSVSENEAKQWAISLLNGAQKGWFKTYYRYRTYLKNNNKYVVVIDQSRELSPCYRNLYISLISGAVGLVIISVLAIYISKKMVSPFEENDNKQKRFIVDAARALRTPVSVISLDNSTIENEFGENEYSKSIRVQINKLLDLSNDLNSLNKVGKGNLNINEINISNILKDVIGLYQNAFEANKKILKVEIEDGIIINGDDGMLRKMLSEVIENSLKYADKEAYISLNKAKERVELIFKNDAKGITEGPLDTIFEKFYRMDYKDHSKYEGNGVGLSIVKEIVDNHKGRVKAKGEKDTFILKIEL